ncbi:hypothetical protein [Mesorhizobium kowhaii]|uniref:hypothetical protein n=1 Tax=Mesorhizobium kowhaii TaxID=1300272 RepID=UPI001FDEFE2D|nr:hypothetical protein [Mesorhizobium kowhaii]
MPGEIIAFFASRERDAVRAGVGLDHLRGELIESGRRLPIELDGRLGGITDQQVKLDWPEGTFVYLDQRLVIPAFAAQLANTLASKNIFFPTRLKTASTKLRTECASPVASTVRLVVLQDGAHGLDIVVWPSLAGFCVSSNVKKYPDLASISRKTGETSWRPGFRRRLFRFAPREGGKSRFPPHSP